MASSLLDPSTVLLCLTVCMIFDFAYLYFKIAKARDLASGAEAVKGVFVFLIALILMWAIAYGILTV